MKINAAFHVLVFLMAVLAFSTPFVTMAQQNFVQAEAATAAEADANKDVSKLLCFSAGCVLSAVFFLPSPYGYLLPPTGIIGAYFYQPGPPPSRLIGKSPEIYIRLYNNLQIKKRKYPSAMDLSGLFQWLRCHYGWTRSGDCDTVNLKTAGW